MTVTLHSATAPKAVWVNGQVVTATPGANGGWDIQAGKRAMVAVLLQNPPEVGFSSLVSRFLDVNTNRDIVRPDLFSPDAVLSNNGSTLTLGGKSSRIDAPKGQLQLTFPFKAPAAAGVLRISTADNKLSSCHIDGKAISLANTQGGYSYDLPMKASETALLQFTGAGTLTFNWLPATAPAL